MASIKWWKVAALSISLAACATGVDVRASNGMVPYASEGEEAALVSDDEVSSLLDTPTRFPQQKKGELAQTSCVQTQPRWQR